VNPLAESMDYDPFFPAIGPAYTAASSTYLHTELKFGRDEEYRVSAFDVSGTGRTSSRVKASGSSAAEPPVPDLAARHDEESRPARARPAGWSTSRRRTSS